MLLCSFEAFLGKLSEKFSLSQNSDYLRKEHRNPQKVCFSKEVCKGANPEENLDFFKRLFLIKQVKLDKYQINKNCISPKNEPHTAKLCFPVVLKHYPGNSQKSSLFIKKKKYLRKKLRNNEKVCFSQQV